MALIKCPECEKEMSDTSKVCIHCGFKLKNNLKSSNQKASSYFFKKYSKIIFLTIIGIIAISTIIGVIINKYNNTYRYSKDGIIGFEGQLKIEDSLSNIDNKVIYETDDSNEENPQYNENWTRYYNVSFFNKYKGTLFLRSSDKENTLGEFVYKVDDININQCQNIIDLLTEKLNSPIHYENLYDTTQSCAYLWDLDEQHYFLLIVHSDRTSIEISCNLIDSEARDKVNDFLENLKSNDNYQQEYDKMASHYNLIGKSIQDVINDNNAVFSKSDYNHVYFTEESQICGFSGVYTYELDNPDSSDFTENNLFIGQIKNISFTFDENTFDSQALIDSFDKIFFENENNRWDAGYFTIYFNANDTSLSFSDITHFYLNAPTLKCIESDKSFSVPEDINTEILQLPDNSNRVEIVSNSTLIDELYSKAKSAVRDKLKSPSSAQFASNSNVSVIRIGYNYYLSSYVEAQNSFGGMVKSDFEVVLSESNGSYSVKGVNFK